jgi:hypothetical protein
MSQCWRPNILIAVLSVLLGTLNWNTPLLAATGHPKNKSVKTQKGKKPKKSKPVSRPSDLDSLTGTTDTSESSPSGPRKIQLLCNAGLSPMPFVGFGASVGILNAQRKGLEAGFLLAGGKSGTIAAQVTQLSGRYRLPFGNFFYGAGGVGLRMAKGSWYVLNQTADAEYKAGASFNAVTLDGAAGAQTSLGPILIGADLVGFSFPLLKMGVKNTRPTEEDYDTADADSQQGKFNKLAAGLTLTVARLGIGIQF